MAVKLMLAEMRTKRGKTQEDLAREMNMSLGGIQYLEYHATSVKLDLLDRLCISLDCEPGDLLKRVRDDTEEQKKLKREKQRQQKSQRMKEWWAKKKQEAQKKTQNVA